MNTYRLTCIIDTPCGGKFAEVVHVESELPLERASHGERIACEFLGAQRGFYGEVRVERVPHFAAPLASERPAPVIEGGQQ